MRPLHRSQLVLLTLVLLALAGCGRSSPPLPAVPAAPPPISLGIERGPAQLEQGGKATLRIVANRQDYQGRIGVELRDLPPGVRAGEAVIREGDNAADIELTATEDAAVGAWDSVRALGTALDSPERQVADARLRVSVAEPRLFDLKAEPAILALSPGSQARVRITVERKRYDGPITVELRNLPKLVSAASAALIRPGESEASIEVSADRFAAPFDPVAVQAVAIATGARNRQVPFDLRVRVRPPFELNPAVRDVSVEQGQKAKFVVTTVRHDYQGPIQLEVVGLPAGLHARTDRVERGGQAGEIVIEAEAGAPVRNNIAVTVRAVPADNSIPMASFPLRLSVSAPVLFRLSVEPPVVKLQAGGSAKVKVTAARKSYQGLIAAEVLNLPAGVTAARASIPQGQSFVEIELTADANAKVGDRPNLAVLGTAIAAGDHKETSPHFTLQVQAALPPFVLKADPAIVRLAPGGSTRLHVTATRNSYQGPITVKVRNLPNRINAATGVIPAGKTTVDIDLNAGAEAVRGDKNDVTVLGTGDGGQEAYSPSITLRVDATPVPFELTADLTPHRIMQGESGKVRVTAIRKGYQGAISLEVVDLPAHVTAAAAVIPAGRNNTDVDLVVGARADVGERRNLTVLGTALAAGGQKNTSNPFTLAVVAAKPPVASFDLRIEPKVVKLGKDDKGKVRVTATRHGYDGPIAVELKNLPPLVRASREVIAKNQTTVEIDIVADPKADTSERNNVHAVGNATVGPNLQAVSPNITLSVQGAPPPKPSIEVRVQPQQVKLTPGGNAKIKVTVVRKHYEGPIGIELSDLPNGVVAGKVIIPAGQNGTQVELSAGPKAPAGSKEVKAGATALAVPNVRDVSPAFTVTVGKK